MTVNGKTFWGYWMESGNKIYLTEGWMNNKKLVEHEMMHAKLQTGLHLPLYFNGGCGDLTYSSEGIA